MKKTQTLRAGKSGAPEIVGVTIDDNVFATKKKFHRRAGKSPADKLVAPYSDFMEILRYLCESGGHSIETVSDRQIMKESKYLNELQMRAEPSAAAAFAGAQKYVKKNNVGFHNKIIIINTGYGLYEPVQIMPWLQRHAGWLSAAAAAGLLTAGIAPYAQDKISEIRSAYRTTRMDEASRIEQEKNQREYLVVRTTDPIEAFAWYNASIEPLEGRGSLLSPQPRKFVLVPDQGKAGLVRLSKSGGYIDNVMRFDAAKAEYEFKEFLKVRERLMETSVYSRNKQNRQ